MKEDIPADLAACIDFHGHLCPGLTIGYLASQIGMKKMQWKRAEDEELICIVMSDGCAVDAVQYLTGCTLGKGNLIFQDYGKMVFVFLRRAKGMRGNGVRIALRARPWKRRRRTAEEISKEEAARTILRMPARQLFTIQPLKNYSIPERAGIFPSQPCAACGELTMEPRLRVKDGKFLCPECRPQDYSRGW